MLLSATPAECASLAGLCGETKDKTTRFLGRNLLETEAEYVTAS